jgi:hypothetical protein
MSAEQKLAAACLAFVDSARVKAAGGLTVAEFGSLTVELLRLAVTGLEEIPADGPAKKTWALGVVGTLFDAVAGFAVPLYLQPFWILAKPLARSLVLAAAGGALEQILKLTRAAAPEPVA